MPVKQHITTSYMSFDLYDPCSRPEVQMFIVQPTTLPISHKVLVCAQVERAEEHGIDCFTLHYRLENTDVQKHWVNCNVQLFSVECKSRKTTLLCSNSWRDMAIEAGKFVEKASEAFDLSFSSGKQEFQMWVQEVQFIENYRGNESLELELRDNNCNKIEAANNRELEENGMECPILKSSLEELMCKRKRNNIEDSDEEYCKRSKIEDETDATVFDTSIEEDSSKNIKFIVAGKVINVDRAIIDARCQVLKKMIDEVGNAIEVENVDVGTFEAFIHYLHTDEIDVYSAKALIPLGNDYKMDCLKKKCEDHLIRDLCKGNAVELLITADLNNCESLKAQASNYINKNYDELMYESDMGDRLEAYPDLFREVLYNNANHYLQNDFYELH